MLKSPPLNGRFPRLQSFGDNPQEYATVICGDVALRGHNGIDFGAPRGTPVFAVQDGTVLAVGDDEAGFGHYVMLGHDWGQSLYAHLERVAVVQGQPVSGGNQLGFSGQSGNSSVPHLHFGMRIHPFSVADGWCGYSDPQPYLDRLTEPRGANIGPHVVGGLHKHLDLLAQWQPRMMLVLDPNPDEIREVRAVCPDTVIVGRPFVPDHEVEGRIRDDPRAAAAWAHDLAMARMTPPSTTGKWPTKCCRKKTACLAQRIRTGAHGVGRGRGLQMCAFRLQRRQPRSARPASEATHGPLETGLSGHRTGRAQRPHHRAAPVRHTARHLGRTA
ncbi:MAG: M23 family metallopeptidase [Caldilineaceae bacterium]